MGMECIAGTTNAIDLISVCGSANDLFALLATTRCDVALIDFAMHGAGQMEGLALLGYLRRTYPDVSVAVLLSNENPVIVHSILERGVASVVSEFDDVGHIVTAIHTCYGGGNYLSPLIKRSLELAKGEATNRVPKLSPREIEVIRLYLSGLSINAIAGRLNKGKQTVSAQKMSAMKKLGVKSDVELIRCATCLDLIGNPPFSTGFRSRN